MRLLILLFFVIAFVSCSDKIEIVRTIDKSDRYSPGDDTSLIFSRTAEVTIKNNTANTYDHVYVSVYYYDVMGNIIDTATGIAINFYGHSEYNVLCFSGNKKNIMQPSYKYSSKIDELTYQ